MKPISKRVITLVLTLGILFPFLTMAEPFGQLIRKFKLTHSGPGPYCCNKNYLFVGNNTNDTIFIYSIHTGGYVGFKKTAFSDYGIFATETRMFVGTNQNTLVTYNISNITNWTTVQTIAGQDNGWLATWAGDTTMIAWNGHWAGTYQFFDISTGTPVSKCKVSSGGHPYSATRYQNYIYIANAYNQNRRVDISNPMSCTVIPWGSYYGLGISSTSSGFIISDAALSTAPFVKEIRNQSGNLTGSLPGQQYQRGLTLPEGYMVIKNTTTNNTTLYDIYDGTFNHPIRVLFNNTLGDYIFNPTYIFRMVNDSCEVYSRFSPTTPQASNILFSNVLTNQFTVNWTDGNGSNRAVFIKQDSVGTSSPLNNTTYTANTVFGTGSQIGTSGWYCVFNGTTHTAGVTVTGLQPNTKYRVMVCEYTGAAGSEQYNVSTATNNPQNQQTCSSEITTNGLVGWWPFSGNADDLSGNGNNGTVYGASLTTDRFGNPNSAYNFNGSSNYIDIPNSTSLNSSTANNTTISAWVNNSSVGGEYFYLGVNYATSAYELYVEDSTIMSRNYNWQYLGGIWYQVRTTSSLADNTWYMATTVFDYSNLVIKLYINGVFNNQVSCPAMGKPPTPHVEIGRNPWPESYMHGKIDDVRLYNRALSDCEISALYQEGLAPNTQATNLAFSNNNANYVTVNWTDGNGSKRAVFIKQDSVGTASPANNTTYTANTTIGSGTQIGTTGWYCVFNGTTHASGVIISGLQQNTKYRVMVCEYNGNPGTEIYNVSSAINNPMNVSTISSTCPGIPTVQYGGQTYNTVQIGTQCWLKENLNIGVMIDNSQNPSNNGIVEKWCQGNLESNCNVYGGLYQWSEMMQFMTTPSAQGICPSGWHIPSDQEWCTLTMFLDPTVNCNAIENWTGTNVGSKMKETGTVHWANPNTGATNSSEFSAFGAGFRRSIGVFMNLTSNALFWSSTEINSTYSYYGGLMYDKTGWFRGTGYREDGMSVRCLKDTCTTYSMVEVSITPSSNPVCEGTSVTLTATPTNGGSSPIYQWKVNGTNITGATNSTYTYVPVDGDSITCVLTSNAECVSGNPATSNSLQMSVISTPVPAGNIIGPTEVCVGSQGITYSVDPILNASNYLWKVPLGVTISSGTGTNVISVNFPSSALTGTINVKGTNVCFNGTQSPNLVITSNALPTGQVVLNNITIPPSQQECLAAQTITTAGSGTTFLVESGGEVTLIASQFIKLLPGTIVQENGLLHAFITNNCVPCSSLKIPLSDSSLFIATQIGDSIEKVNTSSIMVYPNPTSGSFTLEMEGQNGNSKVRIDIFNMRGEKIQTEEIIGENRHEFSLWDKPAGVYFIRVITGTSVTSIKVIKQ